MRPVTGRVFHHAQRVHGIYGVRLSVRHEQTGLLQSVAESVHFRVDEQREQVLYRDVVFCVLDAQCFCEALYVRLKYKTALVAAGRNDLIQSK